MDNDERERIVAMLRQRAAEWRTHGPYTVVLTHSPVMQVLPLDMELRGHVASRMCHEIAHVVDSMASLIQYGADSFERP